MIVRPAPGYTLRRPDTLTILAAGGEDVFDAEWCLRRIQEGSALAGYAAGGGTPTPTPVPTPTPSPVPTPTPTPTPPGTFATVATTGAYADLTGKPDLSIYRTAAQVDARVQQVVGAAPAALDTLAEIAVALANDESVAAALAARVPSGPAGAANGAAVLGSDGKLPATAIPGITPTPASAAPAASETFANAASTSFYTMDLMCQRVLTFLQAGGYVSGTSPTPTPSPTPAPTPTPTPAPTPTPTPIPTPTHYLSLGSDGTGYASTPHTANQNAGSGVFDLKVRMQAGGNTWKAPSGIAFLASRWANGQEYVFGINSDGALIFISRDEAGNYNQSPTFALPAPNGSPLAVRVTGNPGAATAQGIPAHTGRLYTSTDGATWTQAVEYALTGTSMFVTTQATSVGVNGGNAFPANFRILGMTELVNGATVLDVDFTAASAGAATVAGATGGAWTVNAPAAVQ